MELGHEQSSGNVRSVATPRYRLNEADEHRKQAAALLLDRLLPHFQPENARKTDEHLPGRHHSSREERARNRR